MKTLQNIFFALIALLFTAQVQAVLYQARPYDPNLARWISRDPIGENGGLNLVGFVKNNPLNNYDDTGRSSNTSLFYPGDYNIHDNRQYYNNNDTSTVTAEIRSGVNTRNLPGSDILVYGFIASNLKPGGDLDYSWLDNNVYGTTQRYTFNGSYLTGHQFANNLAGYAASYASFQTGDFKFADAMITASVADFVRDILSPGRSANLGAALWDVHNGMILGTMDSLFGSDDD